MPSSRTTAPRRGFAPVYDSIRTLRAAVANAVRHLRNLPECQSGISITEFALVLPILVAMGLFGGELAFMASTRMQVSQMAMSLADNASRIGQTDNSAVTPTVTEQDVDSIMFGALRQGEVFDFENHGRIILTSLERDAATGRQFIHWQRCRGDLVRASAYGDQGPNNGLNGAELTGMGPASDRIAAPSDSAVMFVEIYYEYQPIFGNMFVNNSTIKQEAAFIIRDDRNLRASDQSGITGTGSQSAC